MKKELKKHRNNIVDNNLRDMTRNVFRKEHVEAIIPNADSNSYTKIEGFEVAPDFAATIAKIAEIRAKSKSDQEFIKNMAEITEVYVPEVKVDKEEAKKVAFQDNTEHQTASEVNTEKKKKKTQTILDVTFTPDKKFVDNVIFKSDIKS